MPFYCSPLGQVARSVEQETENPRVGSSILSLVTIKIKGPCLAESVVMCAKARHGNEKQVREAFEDLGGQGPRSQLVHDGDRVHELAPPGGRAQGMWSYTGFSPGSGTEK